MRGSGRRVRGVRWVRFAIVALAATALVAASLAAGCEREEDGAGGDTAGAPTRPESETPSPSVPGSPSPDASQTPTAWPTVSFSKAWTGLSQPLYVTAAGDGSGRLFVLEQEGRIRVIKGGKLLERPFLDLTPLVSSGGERGLLGLAFPPGYERSGRFYVNYTNDRGDTVVARYRVSGSPDVADPGSAHRILLVDQPFPNHNGGCLQFDPKGMLVIGMGDGGAAGDPFGNAQNGGRLLGKLLRLDVGEAGSTDSLPGPRGASYRIPADNPRRTPASAKGSRWRDEIWDLGLRNPWRFSYDRETGDLWIADVGQGEWEEVDAEPAATGRHTAVNWGWDLFEGNHPYPAGTRPARAGMTFPIAEYDHDQGNSITGGYVYRGSAYPNLRGIYVYGDFGSGKVWGLRVKSGAAGPAGSKPRVLLESGLSIASFGEDEEGELYVCDLTGGAVYRVTAR